MQPGFPGSNGSQNLHPTQHPFLLFPVPPKTLPLVYPFFLRRNSCLPPTKTGEHKGIWLQFWIFLLRHLPHQHYCLCLAFPTQRRHALSNNVHLTPQIPPICLLRHLTLHFLSSQTFLCEYSLNISISSTRRAYKNSVCCIVCKLCINLLELPFFLGHFLSVSVPPNFWS